MRMAAGYPVFIAGAMLISVSAAGDDLQITGRLAGHGDRPLSGCLVHIAGDTAIADTSAADGAFLLRSHATGLIQLRTGGPPSGLLRFSTEASDETFDARGRRQDFTQEFLWQVFRPASDLLARPVSRPLARSSASASARPVDTVVIRCPALPEKRIAVPASGTDLGTLRITRPNVILVLADDLGWGELGSYGNAFNETPRLDAMARQGMRFTQAYAAAPVCSPTRGALLTGQNPARVGITDYIRPHNQVALSTDHVTVAERFRDAGYATGILGKWHLSGLAKAGGKEVPPVQHGFQETISSADSAIAGGDYWFPYQWNKSLKRILPEPEFLVDRMNVQAVDFIERHKDEPFFLFYSHFAVHTNLDGKPDLVAKYEAKPGAGKGQEAARNNPHLAAQLESIDIGMGMILDKLEQAGLSENTLVIFTSDNGGETRVTRNANLREGKSTTYEGGTRIPFLVKWPGQVPEGSVSDVPTSTIDYYPTLLEAAAIDRLPDQRIDGVSILSTFRNPEAAPAPRELYWHYPLDAPHFLGGRSSGAVRKGDWKLIEFFDDKTFELYNLALDPTESTDRRTMNPARFTELKALLAAWRSSNLPD